MYIKKVCNFATYVYFFIYIHICIERFFSQLSCRQFTLSIYNYLANIVCIFLHNFRIWFGVKLANSFIRKLIVPLLMYNQPRGRRRRGPFFPRSSIRDTRFEILEFVLLTLGFPFRLGLPGYYWLSGRFVMTPEAAILVLSAAHYRRGMTVVAFIFFFLSLLLCLSLLFSFVQLRREYFRRKSCAPSLFLYNLWL